ncbi:MAG: UPF0755 protein [Sphingobacteriales bacterium]|jgi:UPF0755 protein
MLRRFRKILTVVLIVLTAVFAIVCYNFYQTFWIKNIDVTEPVYIEIYPENSYRDVVQQLAVKGVLENKNTFDWAARVMNYTNAVKPGRYALKSSISNKQLIAKLRSGNQDPVRITFNNLRKIDDLAGAISKQLVFDSLTILNLLQSDSVAHSYGFNKETFLCMFVPNTYEFYWTTSAPDFISKMKKEYDVFWNKDRLAKAQKLNLNPIEVSILASIVDLETAKDDEMPRIAGLYWNRLDQGRKLEADPTVVFSVGDFNIKRVLNIHLRKDSPYNTYKNNGLPPGPIYLPSVQAINAVLNKEDHDYLFMCAKDDFSGYHAFAESFSEHKQNANKFRKALNDRKIMK